MEDKSFTEVVEKAMEENNETKNLSLVDGVKHIMLAIAAKLDELHHCQK